MTDPVKDELDFYIEERTRELVAQGVEPAEARRQAKKAFGPRSAIEGELVGIQRRRARRARTAGLASSVRQAVRSLVRRPGYAALVIGTLALGIGAATTIFSVVDAVLLEEPPFASPDRLVTINESDARRPHRNPSPADFLDLRREVDAFGSISAYDTRSANLLGTGEPENIDFADVSADFFRTLGVEAAVGRTFGPETVPEGTRLAVLSHGFWVRRFGAAPDVVGRTLRLDEHSYQIVGVMPEEMSFPAGVELWTAATYDVPGAGFFGFDPREMRDIWYHRVIARLAPGVSAEAAADELAAKASEWASRYPTTHADAQIWLRSLTDERVRDVRGTLLLLLGATGLVLLIACANVANLVLIQAAGRSREWAVRQSLGAPRGRIVFQVLTESALLAVGGAVGGIALAWLAVETLRPAVAPLLPAGSTVALDAGVLAFSTLLAALAALAFGTLPAWSASRRAPGEAIDRGAGSRSASRADRRIREGLVAVEISLAVVLVLVSGLLLRSLWALNDVDLGFEPDGLVAAYVGLPGATERSHAEISAFYGGVLEQVAALPGVGSAAWTMRGPLSLGPGAGLRIQGVTDGSDDLVSTRWQVVSPGYFDAAGTPLRSGRVFTAGDGTDGEPVGVVNETLARRFFPSGGALGSLVNTGLDGRDGDAPRWVRVVGIVGDTKNRGPAGVTEPVLYRPMGQPTPGFRGDGALLIVRGAGRARAGAGAGRGAGADDAAGDGGRTGTVRGASEAGPARTVRGPNDVASLGSAIRRAVAAAEPDAPVGAIVQGNALADGYLSSRRLILALLGSFAGIALTLGAVGIYGIARYAVLVQTREIGVRMALGAEEGQVARMVLRQGARPALVGTALGLLVSFGVVRLLASRLHQISTSDPITWASVPAVLLAVAMVATWLPARRAASIDPVTAIRGE